MIKTLAAVVAVAIAAILAMAALKPATFRIQRSIDIKAPPQTIFALIDNLHHWQSWSPFEKKDPEMKRTFSGVDSGVGAAYAWEGNRDIGKGHMEITASDPNAKIVIRLDFLKPFEAHNTAEFLLEPQGDSTRITWAMYGPNSFAGKVMSIFINMDQMIGKDFEAGLRDLKAVAER